MKIDTVVFLISSPIAKWVRTSVANYNMTAELAWELVKEYEFRYGANVSKKKGSQQQKKEHACKQHIIWLMNHAPPSLINGEIKERTKMALAMPDEYKTDDPVESYRQLYIHEKSKFARWNRGRG